MLNVHDSFVILPLLFCFMLLEDGSCALVTLALRINMRETLLALFKNCGFSGKSLFSTSSIFVESFLDMVIFKLWET